MNEDEKLKVRAEEFIRANREQLARESTDPAKYFPDDTPTSVFMAGSPGAGKTELSKALIAILEKNKNHKIIRIDSDELRDIIPGYTGANSYLFQGAVSLLVEKIHDQVLKNRQSFLLDGTFSKYEKAVQNINRSLSKNRPVLIFYVYQKPEVAWKFTQAREMVEGRNIPKDAFIQQFLESRKTITRIRNEFDQRVRISIVKKNFETHAVEDIIEVLQDGKSIDDYLDERYDEDDLKKLL